MGKIAFVFAGQGAQYSGMGNKMYENNSAAKKIFDIAESIKPGIKDLCFNGNTEQLSITSNTQPALFTMDLACAEALKAEGITPDCVAGFSLGETAAVAFSEMLTVEDAFRFVCMRGQFMQECSEKNKGAMIVVLKLDNEKVEEICRIVDNSYPVNYNSPGQIVVACAVESCDDLIGAIKKEGGRTIKLTVSGAFHSPFMNEASEKLREYLKTVKFNKAKIPVYANISAKPYPSDIADTLADQVNHPVRWEDTINNMIADRVDTFIEVGAGKVLCGLIQKISSKIKTINVENTDDIIKVKELLQC
ncbi:MAG: [acyl-carrier-protein] S-malonyltransferase [Clostridiales bacterium GWF2_38_85]|nr:MAG: [acyl-carrier-protein] S-malonyltransferase [Clostridiales bacterium GWF2_38_85]HBL85245.1 [acyl-carrier-protein] S-malonyltransferase [Clostridiales bacterium]